MIVLDASVVVAAITPDDMRRAMTHRRIGSGELLCAPDLVDVETLHAIRKRWIGNGLSARQCELAIRRLRRLPLRRHATSQLLPRAFELRHNLTAYDAVYVALAESLSCTLLTADARLAKVKGTRCAIEVLSDP